MRTQCVSAKGASGILDHPKLSRYPVRLMRTSGGNCQEHSARSAKCRNSGTVLLRESVLDAGAQVRADLSIDVFR